MNNKNIVWVASFPKSGNTWMRSILTALIYADNGKFDFNLLSNIDQFENIKNFEFIKKINENDYNNLNKMENISKYWQKAQENFTSKKLIFFKTHSANYNFNNLRYVNLNKVRGCIYLLRDPRDVVISYSKFIGSSIDETINRMAEPNRQIYNQEKTVGIILSRWDYHITSWLKLNSPKIIIKYEDLLTNTEKVINELINFLKNTLKIDLKINKNKIAHIIETTSFKKLKQKEEDEGFIEASKKSKFFRSGTSLQWKTELKSDQIEKIERNFQDLMKKFNYLN